jgi:hypothetical protein
MVGKGLVFLTTDERVFHIRTTINGIATSIGAVTVQRSFLKMSGVCTSNRKIDVSRE